MVAENDLDTRTGSRIVVFDEREPQDLSEACDTRALRRLPDQPTIEFDPVPSVVHHVLITVTEEVAADFAEQAKAALTRLYGPRPAASPDLSRVITQDAARRIAGLLESAPILAGGHADVERRLVEPTLVYPATWDMPVMREEIFGPVLPILTYRDLDEVIDTIKRRPTPLAAYIFSRDEEHVERLLTALPFGCGAVNQTIAQTFFTLPFGGVGASGLGQYFGKHVRHIEPRQGRPDRGPGQHAWAGLAAAL